MTTHIGVVPEDKNHPRYQIMQEACGKLAEYADSLDAHFAIETGPEPAKRLREFLDSLGSRGVAVNFDPANLVMVVGDDPAQAVRDLGEYIVHTHAKDGKMLIKTKPEIIYGAFDESQLETGIQGVQYFLETPLGEGSVPFDDYCAALNEIGFKGYLCIEREVGESPEKDIRTAVEFLKGLI